MRRTLIEKSLIVPHDGWHGRSVGKAAPAVRITTPHIPLPAADRLEDHVLPSVDRIVERCRSAIGVP